MSYIEIIIEKNLIDSDSNIYLTDDFLDKN